MYIKDFFFYQISQVRRNAVAAKNSIDHSAACETLVNLIVGSSMSYNKFKK